MEYAFAIVDLSYLLQRNLYAVKSKHGDVNPGEVVQMTIQTLNKIPRDYGIEMRKYIFIADKWDETIQGYHRHNILRGVYKTSRSWMNQEKYEEILSDPTSSREDIEKAKAELKLNEVRTEAKRILKEELRYFGVPCIWQSGFEFDDCAWLFSCLWYENPDPRRSVIITKDSDLQYSINPKVDYFRLPTRGSVPEIITYNQMYLSIPEVLRNKGISLYMYKAMYDSLGMGHNDLRKTKRSDVNVDQCIENIMDGDYSGCSDPDLFKLQLSTFDIGKFPGFEELKGKLTKDIFEIGRLGSVEEFRLFCKSHGITQISDRYYSAFISRFDQRLFTE